jgi:hypothetical protein
MTTHQPAAATSAPPAANRWPTRRSTEPGAARSKERQGGQDGERLQALGQEVETIDAPATNGQRNRPSSAARVTAYAANTAASS